MKPIRELRAAPSCIAFFARLSVAALLLSPIAAPTAYAQTTVVGNTSGAFAVAESGAATYRIPIQVPPGVAGMEPKLEFVYGSQAPNGIMGLGWSVQGLGAVTRCPLTRATDGVAKPVNYDIHDRFCLDGSRMILISGAHYGVAGSEYRTEVESFSRITAAGAAGVGPASFKVQTKSGLTMDYGSTADSRVEATGQATVRLWALNKITDTRGNTLEVSYFDDIPNGLVYPMAVSYGTGRIVFEYEARPDGISGYAVSSVIRTNVRLKTVRTYADQRPVKEFRLAYERAAWSGKSRLVSVTECNPETAECLHPLVMSYASPVVAPVNHAPSAHSTGGDGWQLADLFGDGRQVYWTRGGSSHFASRLNPDGTSESWNWQGHSAAGDGWQLANLFGDGRQVYWTRGGQSHFATRLNSDGTAESWNWVGHGTGGAGWRLVDLFGDGRQVYWTRGGTNDQMHYVTRLNPDGTAESWEWLGWGTGVDGWDFADLFGDGRQVYWTRNGSTHYATRLNSDSTVENWTWQGHSTGGAGWRLVDLFGEGRQVYWTRGGTSNATHYATRLNADGTVQSWQWNGWGSGADGWDFADLFGDGRLVYWTRTGSTHYATRLNPDGTVENWTWQGHSTGGAGWRLIDLFGDGRQVYWTRGGTNNQMHYVTRLNPDGTAENWEWLAWGTGSDGWEFADLFGDGRPVYWTRNGAVHHTSSFSSGAQDVLTGVRSGGAQQPQLVVGYTPLSMAKSEVYTKGTGGAHPVTDLKVPLSVVSSVAVADGIGGMRTTRYQYGGLRAELGTGRGLLGFRWARATDLQTGMESYTEYRQDWPFTGMPAKSETRLPGAGNNGLLTRATHTYAQTPGTVGNRFPHRTHSVEESWDLGGVTLPSLTTTVQYLQSPQFGDPTKIQLLTSDGASKSTVNEYLPADTSGGKWLLGRLKRATVTSTKP